jgi:hypothetical protein
VRRFQRRAFGLARTTVDDSATAEDVAQQAFVRAWHYAGSDDARRGSVLTWLLAIVRNVAAVAGAELVERNGRRVPLESFGLAGCAWGGSLPRELGALAAIHLVDSGGRPVLVARF